MSRLRRRWNANLFLPYLRKSQRRGVAGRVYAGLQLLGPVSASSPIRRTVQVIALALFLWAFYYVSWPYARHFDDSVLTSKEYFPVELFLLIDPLVGVSTALAGKWVNTATLCWTVGIVLICMLVPRGFCGYLCPLGTLIDGFDWLAGSRFKRFHQPDNGPTRWWMHLKYYILAGVLVAACAGVLLSGYVSAIPVVTRGMLLTGGRIQLAWQKGASNLPEAGWAMWLSVLLFAAVFLLSIGGRRFWCRYVCPSGALLSLTHWFRVGERKVEDTCISCNKCVEICPFDAIHADFTTRISDCTFCQTCGGVCPTQAIQFGTRWRTRGLKEAESSVISPPPLSRRGVLAAAVLGLGAAAATGSTALGAGRGRARPVRPPGSVPEDRFNDLCIRCGQCLVVCPGPVLRIAGLEYGLDAIWSPVADLNHAGCHQDCNHCTQVCPTGAIQPLDLPLKRTVHMGLAEVDTQICLPFRPDGRQDCDLCFVECEQAGYRAIEMRDIRIELSPPPPAGMFSADELEEMSRIRAPHVDPVACVGCGICQYRCYTRFVVQERLLPRSAIVVSSHADDRQFTRNA